MLQIINNNEIVAEVKSISAAWNKIREIRDNTPVEDINETILKVDMGEAQASDRLPLEILFRVNTKGKVEFKDLHKVLERAAKKEEAKAKAEAETLRDEIKAEMLNRNTEEMEAGQYIIRWTSVLSQRFDTTSFKKVYGDLYKEYTKQTASRRFSIA